MGKRASRRSFFLDTTMGILRVGEGRVHLFLRQGTNQTIAEKINGSVDAPLEQPITLADDA
jgi:hypothetical protein